VRDYASTHGLQTRGAVEAGMQEKSAEFRKAKEIYVPAEPES